MRDGRRTGAVLATTLLATCGLVTVAPLGPVASASTTDATSLYTPLTPARILDTRKGTGAPQVPLAADDTIALTVDGEGGVPSSGVTAVVLNVTVTAPTQSGYITAYADGSTRPTASNLNYTAGETVPNLVVVPVGSDGKVDLFNGSGGSTQLVADVSGYFTDSGSATPGAFGPLTPARLLDTRRGTGAPEKAVAANGTVSLAVEGHGGVPATGVTAVVLNVTVTVPTQSGYITVYADGTTRPTASNLNYTANETVPNLVVAPVGSDGKVDLFNGSGGSTQLVADVSGYFSGGTTTEAGAFTSLAPARLLDTRKGTGAPEKAVTAYGTVTLAVAGRGGVPPSGIIAAILNVTVTAPTQSGYITAYGDGTTRPTASNLDYTANETVPNLVVAPVGTDGEVDLYNGSAGSTQLVADVAGYVMAAPPEPLSGVKRVVGDCALLNSGGVDCWGYGDRGQLGDGIFYISGDFGSSTAVQVVGVNGTGTLSGVSALASDGGSSCALLGSGEVDCWGGGYNGELGNGTFTRSDNDGSATPVQVVGVGGSGILSGVSSITSGEGSYCALLSSDEVDCWGHGTYGDLGDGSFTDSAIPVQVVRVGGTGVLSGVASLVSDGSGAYCAVLASGGADCWGYGPHGELGNGSFTTSGNQGSDLPVAVVGVGATGLLSGVTGLWSAAQFTYCAVLVSGGVDCWGYGPDGELGDGVFYTSGNQGSAVPVQVVGVGGTGTLSGAASLASAGLGLCALLESGLVDCWGLDGYGQLGDGSYLTTGPFGGGSATPVQVVGEDGTGTLSGVASLLQGETDVHCALLTSGGVDCWGFGGLGALGDGIFYDGSDNEGSAVPVEVVGEGGTGTLSGVVSLFSDRSDACALVSSGEVDCWGGNNEGDLGNGTFSTSAIPVAVLAPTS